MPKNRFFTVFSAGCSALLLLAGNASAQTSPSSVQRPVAAGPTNNIPAAYTGPSTTVAAVIDDKVVTTYDVEQRMKLMIVSSGGRISQEMLGQLQTQALRDLVQERLKKNEATRWEFEVEAAEVDAELQRIAAQGGLTVPQLEQALASDGISIRSLREQVEAGIAWPQLVQGRFGSRVRVGDDEIEQTLERMREDAASEQYLVSEICIPVADQSQAQAYYQGGLQLIEQMRRGVPFAVIAQQFSACTTAATGGDMGWIRAGELPEELDQAIRELPAGAVTNPIPSEGAFMILALRDKREAVAKGEESFTFAYASAPLSVGRAAARQALEKLETSDACSGAGNRQDLGANVGVAMIENIAVSAIDERFRSAVEDLERGELGPIIEVEDNLHTVYVCEKDEGFGLPSRDSVKDRIFGRQLTRIAQQYLRDVERESLVDIRLRTEGGPVASQQPNG